MSQTSAIAGGLVIAFIVFVTVRGQLPCYFQVLGISTAGGASCPSNMGAGATAGNAFTGGSGPSQIGVRVPINIGVGGGGGGISIGIGGGGIGIGIGGGGFGGGF